MALRKAPSLGLFTSESFIFLSSNSINFHSAFSPPVLWFVCNPSSIATLLAVFFIKSFSFNILPVTLHTPPAHPDAHSGSPASSSPRYSLSFPLSPSTMVRSHGERQLAASGLAAIATGSLPLPQVSLATGSLALL